MHPNAVGRSILTALKRENEKKKDKASGADRERKTEREHHVDKAERNNGLMVIESRQNNHCSPPNTGVM